MPLEYLAEDYSGERYFTIGTNHEHEEVRIETDGPAAPTYG
jgi:hypothetical protein